MRWMRRSFLTLRRLLHNSLPPWGKVSPKVTDEGSLPCVKGGGLRSKTEGLSVKASRREEWWAGGETPPLPCVPRPPGEVSPIGDGEGTPSPVEKGDRESGG